MLLRLALISERRRIADSGKFMGSKPMCLRLQSGNQGANNQGKRKNMTTHGSSRPKRLALAIVR